MFKIEISFLFRDVNVIQKSLTFIQSFFMSNFFFVKPFLKEKNFDK